MKNILLFGAGKSATCLIDFIIAHAPKNKWHLTIVDNNMMLIRAKIGKSYYATAESFDIKAPEARRSFIEKADIVISLLPPDLHKLVAFDCLEFKKHLLTASYLDEDIKKLSAEVEKAGVLFMGEMGLDPGIDHMSAMQIIDSIERKGGEIYSFRSYCGGLVAPGSDDNPWNYKISWNPRNIVMAGKSGAVYKEKGKVKEVPYEELFNNTKAIQVPSLGKLAYYPNRDSLYYQQLYKLDDVQTFMRATLRFPEFCEGWNALIKLGLTSEDEKTDTEGVTYYKWATQHISDTNTKNHEETVADFLGVKEKSKLIRQLKYLGFLNGDIINKGEKTNAAILQTVLEEKLQMQPEDKDMVVMQHEVEFERRNIVTKLTSYMINIGEDNMRTAMAKTVGLPLGILTKLMLEDKVQLSGVHIPIMPEIYNPVLKELEEVGIQFKEEFT